MREKPEKKGFPFCPDKSGCKQGVILRSKIGVDNIIENKEEIK
jgi:hypothetical protein